MRELSHLEGESYDHLVYVRIFEGCNLRCKHCFIPANPKKMDMEDVRDIPNKLKGKVQQGQRYCYSGMVESQHCWVQGG